MLKERKNEISLYRKKVINKKKKRLSTAFENLKSVLCQNKRILWTKTEYNYNYPQVIHSMLITWNLKNNCFYYAFAIIWAGGIL